MKKLFLLIFIFPLFAQAQSKIILYEDTASMRKEILVHIPIGIDTIAARKIMRQNKFKCTMMRKERFADGNIMHENADFIYCDRSKHRGFIEMRWQIILVHKNGKIGEVYVSFGLIGP